MKFEGTENTNFEGTENPNFEGTSMNNSIISKGTENSIILKGLKP